MISAGETGTGDGQIRLPVMVFETAESRANSQVLTPESLRNRSPYEVNLSGTQLLVGFIAALSSVGLLLWAFLKLWLFEHLQ